MSRSLDVEIFAMAVGVKGECGMGTVQHDVEITSETTIMHLSVQANILLKYTYILCKHNHACFSLGHPYSTKFN